MIEKTCFENCINCGIYEEVCFFGARKIDGDELVMDRDDCYGCGLCLDMCPEGCIKMVARG